MKYLLLFLLFLALGWHWRNRRSGQLRQRARQTKAQSGAIAMVPCAHCATHLPQDEAVAGTLGHYCSAEHRAAREP